MKIRKKTIQAAIDTLVVIGLVLVIVLAGFVIGVYYRDSLPDFCTEQRGIAESAEVSKQYK